VPQPMVLRRYTPRPPLHVLIHDRGCYTSATTATVNATAALDKALVAQLKT